MSDAQFDLGIDPSTLSESEQQLIELFESRKSGSLNVDDTTPVSAEELAEPTGTPGSTASPTAASEAPPTVEGQSGASENAPSPVTPPVTPPATPPVSPAVVEPPVPPVEGEPPVADQASTAPAFTFAGVDYSPDQVARAIQVHDWYDRLNDNQVQAVDALLSGQYRLVPANEAAPVPPITQQGQPQPPVTPPAPTDIPAVGDEAGEWLDPRAQAEVNRLQSQLDQIRQQFNGAVTPLVQSQVDAQHRQHMQSIDNATSAFKDAYQLDDSLIETIGRSVVQAGVLPSLIQQHQGNVEAATRQAYEMMFWTTPTFRDAYMQSKNTADLADLAVQEKANADKQRKMTALTASGGSAPRITPKANTHDERYAGMIEMIRADMNGV